MHATKFANIGFKYLNGLEFHELCQLQNELNQCWKNGQSVVSNHLYDKVADSVNYELTKLKNDPYEYGVKTTDEALKNLIDYLTQQYSQGQPLVDNSVFDILNQECQMRTKIDSNSILTYPSNWTTMSLNEIPIQFLTLSRTSKEFLDISNYFLKSLGKPSIIIYSIIRIQNLRLWYIFEQLGKIISNNCQRLIHGTSSSTQQKLIMYHGFYHSFCPGGLIGDGVYFAVHADYSDHDPYVLKRSNHRRELFICQVLLGNSSQGSNGLKSPAQGCHSVYHYNNAHNDMFCIFNQYQAYPEYIVQYDYE